MELPINSQNPTILHLDLNSCFATVEQQANPLLRNKPVVVAAYNSPGGCVLAASIEAKQYGIYTGMRVKDAQRIYPKVIVLTPDPPKYRDVHRKIRQLLDEYSPCVIPKSIDEYVIDMKGVPHKPLPHSFPDPDHLLINIAREIKQRIRGEIGDWLFCNIGIGPNRFLAKLAASLHKPDGLDYIDHRNLLDIYRQTKLLDFCGINRRYQTRLNNHGIFNPLEFFYTPLDVLTKRVFKSICGYYWYMRVRGWEVDNIDYGRKSYGHSYALPLATADLTELSHLLMKLCEKMGRRLRANGQSARGIHVVCLYKDHTYWHTGHLHPQPLFTTQELFRTAFHLLKSQPVPKPVANLAVNCYRLQASRPIQLNLFGEIQSKKYRLAQALDEINNRYGEFVVTPALMLNMQSKIIDRIAFGK